MRFSDSWVNWIMQCVSTVSYSILVNGEPTGKITPKAGLRQGDPLSPYLFILCIELLSKRLCRLQHEGKIEGLKISRRAPMISHLFFADDALFFLNATIKNFSEMKNIMAEFCSISGEMINLQKSYVIFSKNIHHRFKRILRSIIGVQDQPKLGTYLRCPIEVDGRSKEAFSPLLEKITQKFSSWKFVNLSQAGKLILINSIIVEMASHVMSIYLVPKSVLSKINSLMLKFWWSSSVDKRPIYWRKQSLLENHKAEGGLGLRNIFSLNQALVFRQAWRLQAKPHLLASRVFKAKYGDGWFANAVGNSMPSTPSWAARGIMKSVASMKAGLRRIIGNVSSLTSLGIIGWERKKLLLRLACKLLPQGLSLLLNY